MKLTLLQAAQFTRAKTFNIEDAEITSITTDTREIRKGSLFVALKGERFDGHDFAIDAINKGAIAVLSQKDETCFARPIPLLVVDDTYKALLALAAGYRRMLDISVVGVTGSVGKTSTKDMIASILQTAVKTAKTEGNLNNHIGVPKTIFSITEEDRAAVIEMGMNHEGEISVLSHVAAPDIAVITNVFESHIENLKTRENILKAKLEILEGMNKDAPVIVNADNDMFEKMYEIGEHRVIRCSASGKDAFFTATGIKETEAGIAFEINVDNTPLCSAFIPVAGVHNVQNALLSAATAYVLGVSGEKISQGLSRFTPSGMRQKITSIAKMKFIEDCYNASPTSMKASLDVLKNIQGTRKVAVLGDMLELGEIEESAHKEVGKYAAECADLVVACGQRAKLIADAAVKEGKKAVWFETISQTLEYLTKELKEDDCVLFKASHSMQFEKIITGLYTALN